MEWAFGSPKDLARFNRWVRRERNAAATDVAGNTKVGSITSNAMLASEATDIKSNPLMEAFKGYAFGGTPGGVAGFVRGMSNKLRGRTDDVQEIMARLLMSKGSVDGERISEGIRRTGSRVAKREADRKAVLRQIGRGTGPLLSSAVATRKMEDDEE